MIPLKKERATSSTPHAHLPLGERGEGGWRGGPGGSWGSEFRMGI